MNTSAVVVRLMCIMSCCSLIGAAEGAISLGSEVVPGCTLTAAQAGTWEVGQSVTLEVAVTDDNGQALATSVSVRSGASDIPESQWGPEVVGPAGSDLTYPVAAFQATHTLLYVTVVDTAGNRMTGRFPLRR